MVKSRREADRQTDEEALITARAVHTWGWGSKDKGSHPPSAKTGSGALLIPKCTDVQVSRKTRIVVAKHAFSHGLSVISRSLITPNGTKCYVNRCKSYANNYARNRAALQTAVSTMQMLCK